MVVTPSMQRHSIHFTTKSAIPAKLLSFQFPPFLVWKPQTPIAHQPIITHSSILKTSLACFPKAYRGVRRVCFVHQQNSALPAQNKNFQIYTFILALPPPTSPPSFAGIAFSATIG